MIEALERQAATIGEVVKAVARIADQTICRLSSSEYHAISDA